MGLGLVATISFIGAGICAVVAAGKGRNPLLWLLIGAALPLVGVIMIVLLRPAENLYRPTTNASVPATAPPSPIELRQQLGELKERGVVSEVEFEAKKGELLARV